MSTYGLLCLLSALALVTAVLTSRFSQMQTTSAITLVALCLSMSVILGGKLFDAQLQMYLVDGLNRLDFKSLLVNGMLGFLLFAGALNIRLGVLKSQGWEIFILSFFSTLLSVVIVGYLLWIIAPFLGITLPITYCLLFGTIISPTDPVAVMAIIQKMGAPREIAVQVEGESLFNDGIGLVFFVAISQWTFSEELMSWSELTWLFLHEAVGGLLFGLILFVLLKHLIRWSDDSAKKMLLTFLAPTTGYVLANLLTVSAPLAMVSCGIALGNWTGSHLFNRSDHKRLKRFWFFIEEYFNSLLFLLIGFLLLLVKFHSEDWLFMLAAVPIVLLARAISVMLPYLGFRQFKQYNPMAEHVLIWGGLRGGLALAMAMSVPSGIILVPDKQIDLRELVMVMAYAVVMFSIIVQGSTINGIIQKSNNYNV